MNIQTIRTARRPPWQNAYVERVIGLIRRECLDHVIVTGEAGVRRVLASYVAYYMRSRTHLGLAKDTPGPRPIQLPSVGRIVTTPEVGGLHHRYERVAARREVASQNEHSSGSCRYVASSDFPTRRDATRVHVTGHTVLVATAVTPHGPRRSLLRERGGQKRTHA